MSAVRAALLGLLLAAPAAARAADILQELGIPPTPPARGVYDGAGLLDPGTLAEIEDLTMRLRQGSGHEVLLVTVPELKQRPIEDVGLQIGRDWKLGEADLSDAAVLLVSRDDRALRIEVGRGLEGNLTDLVCGQIIRNVIVPSFQQGDFAGGLLEGVKAIHAAAGGDYADIPHGAPVNVIAPVLLAVGIIMFIVIMLLVAARRGGGGGRGSGWRGPVIMPFPFPTNLGGFGGGGSGGGFGGGGFGGGFRGFGGGGGGFSGGGASGRW